MRIEQVMIEPDQPKAGDLLEVKVGLYNDSTEEATALVNAVLSSSDLSFPVRMQQAQVTLEPDESKVVTLFKVVVDKYFRPARYQVRVQFDDQRGSGVEAQFRIKEAKMSF